MGWRTCHPIRKKHKNMDRISNPPYIFPPYLNSLQEQFFSMTTTFRNFALHNLLKNNERAHNLFMLLIEDCDLDDTVFYTSEAMHDRGLSKKHVREDLRELSHSGLLNWSEEPKGIFIKLLSDWGHVIECSGKDLKNNDTLENENAEQLTRHSEYCSVDLTHTGTNTKSSLSDPAINAQHFKRDFSMDFFKVPSSITRSEVFLSLSLTYRCIFYAIMDYMSFSEKVLDDHGEEIILKPGQLMMTTRKMEEKFGFPKTTIGRALEKFEKLGFLGQEVGHVKTIITLKEPYLSETFGEQLGTRSGTRVGQEWDTNKNIRSKERESLSYDKDISAQKNQTGFSTYETPVIMQHNINDETQNSSTLKELSQEIKSLENKIESQETKSLKKPRKPRKQRLSPAEPKKSIFATGEQIHFGKSFKSVILYEGEYNELVKTYGFGLTEEKIQNLDTAIGEWKDYAVESVNHYATLIKWLNNKRLKMNEPKLVPINSEPKFVGMVL